MRVITQLNGQTEIRALRALLEKYGYGRYCEDPALPISASRSFLVSNVQDYIARPENKSLAVTSSTGNFLGMLLYRQSQWDTDHFGYPVAIVDRLYTGSLGYEGELEVANTLLRHFEAWCRDIGIRFISARVPATHLPVVHSFEQHAFRFIETWIFNKFDLNRLGDLNMTLPALRKADQGDIDLMLEYSKGAFATQRFHADPRIEPDKADSLYRKWILTAAADPHQEILALDVAGKPVAFMIFYRLDLRGHFDLQFAMWKMALLDPGSRSKGVGTDFFLALMREHRRQGFDVVDSGLSMRNLASLNLHNKLGFKILTTMITFHKWMN